MPNFKNRSSQQEMLDMPGHQKQELEKNLQEISKINKLLGGDRITWKGLKFLMTDRDKKYRIVDIGCGDGGMLRRILKWARTHGLQMEILGIDINPDAVEFAREKSMGYSDLSFKTIGYEDYFNTNGQNPDIIISSLFCHHLDDYRLREFLEKMMSHCNTGFIVNDLHRHFLAYYSIRWLTMLFSRSKLTKNDAPISVERGFKKKDLESHFDIFPTGSYWIRWQWAFRYLAIAKKP